MHYSQLDDTVVLAGVEVDLTPLVDGVFVIIARIKG